MIDTREELVNALSEAAELEHGLLVQYLFAAFSMKRKVDEGITSIQQALMVDWKGAILRVAHEEMYHLASVCGTCSRPSAERRSSGAPTSPSRRRPRSSRRTPTIPSISS